MCIGIPEDHSAKKVIKEPVDNEIEAVELRDEVTEESKEDEIEAVELRDEVTEESKDDNEIEAVRVRDEVTEESNQDIVELDDEGTKNNFQNDNSKEKYYILINNKAFCTAVIEDHDANTRVHNKEIPEGYGKCFNSISVR